MTQRAARKGWLLLPRFPFLLFLCSEPPSFRKSALLHARSVSVSVWQVRVLCPFLISFVLYLQSRVQGKKALSKEGCCLGRRKEQIPFRVQLETSSH